MSNEFLPSWRVRFGLFTFAICQNGLLGGTLFGWASIDKTLLSESIEKGGAGLNLNDTTLIFTWASSVGMFSPFLLGMVLDNFGPRTCSFLSNCIIICGFVMFSFSEEFWEFAVGATLIGFGGAGITSSIVHISNLFPGHENMAMGCLTGSVAISFSVFAVFDIIWNQVETTVQEIFLYFASLATAFAIGAFWLFPDEPFEKVLDVDHREQQTSTLVSDVSDSVNTSLVEKDEPTQWFSSKTEQPLNSYLRDERKILTHRESFYAAKKVFQKSKDEYLASSVTLKDRPFLYQVTSATYLRSTLVFMITAFLTNFYVASISTELADLQEYDDSAQHGLTRSFTVIMSLGFFVSVFVGWLIDRIGVESCMAITLILGQCQMLLLMFEKQQALLVTSFWFYTFFRQFLYPVYISSLMSRLGFKYFGVLLGIGFGLAGLAQLFLSTLGEVVRGDCHLFDVTDEECDKGYWIQFHFFQIVLLGILFLVPIQEHKDKLLREKTIKEILSIKSPRPSTKYGST